jgi:hypothetical protein
MVKCLEAHSAHFFSGGLPTDTYAEIVKSASEAASLAVFRALESGAFRLSQNVPASCDHDPPDLDGNQSGTDALQPFRRTFPRDLCSCMIMGFFFSITRKKEGSAS